MVEIVETIKYKMLIMDIIEEVVAIIIMTITVVIKATTIEKIIIIIVSKYMMELVMDANLMVL